MPGDGSEVHTSEVRRDDPSVNVVEIPAENVPWKEKVVGRHFIQAVPKSG